MDSSIHITLFFTYGVSLETWAKTGLLQREIRIYQKLMNRHCVQIQFLTYGDISDRNWESELGGIKLLPVYERMWYTKSTVLSFLQTLFIPWFFRYELNQTDMLKTNQMWGSWVAVLTRWLFSKPLLVRCGFEHYKTNLQIGNRGIRHYFLKWLSKLTYSQASHIWLNTREIAEFVITTFKVSPSRLTIFPNWIDTKQFSPIQKISKKLNRILFVGRLHHEKNIHLLFYALQNTDIGVDIVGTGVFYSQLKHLASRLKLDAKFLDSFSNDQMPGIYNRYPIYVLCSKYEGNPKTLLEAMACGLAVIGTNVPGIREIIINGNNGLLVPEDSSALRKSIQTLLSDKSLCQRLGNNARKTILKNNSMEQAIAKEYSIYQQLTD